MNDITNIEEILTKAAEDAFDGSMTDATRVSLYELALTVAANELHRIESVSSGTVAPESLLLIHQMSLLCVPGLTPAKLFGSVEGEWVVEEDESQD